ncbi:MAG: ABC transporter permease subunit [Defluviitaleaceae bacterium]|nr:ABC transporter permease subunit [Defluviitaleaceae bacterium]MCL2274553.1 ABC transporter permease subunit [Defluviitaleaceae bacterium]
MIISSSFRKFLTVCAVALFWLLVWEGVAAWVGATIILVPPRMAFARLFTLAQTLEFWLAIFTSLRRIMLGFALAMFTGIFLATGAAASKIFRHIILPAINVLNAMPLASFVILVLFMFGRENLSIVVPFVMVMPIAFHNVYKGITTTDPALLEMAHVFRVPLWKRIRYIYLHSVRPFIFSAATIGIGFAWKSGISAELIGVARGTIGGYLHRAQISIQPIDMYAWTIAIITLSYAIDKCFYLMLGRGIKNDAHNL